MEPSLTFPTTSILWLTDNYYPSKGGMAQSCDRIVYTLRQRGVAIDLVHFTKSSQDSQELKHNGIDLICNVYQDTAHSCNRIWNKFNTVWKKKMYTHCVVFGGMYSMLCGPIFSRWLHCPLITCIRGNDFDVALFTPKRQDILLRALSASSAICSVTNEKKGRISSLIPDADVHWTPNGIDISRWKATNDDYIRSKQLKKNSKDKIYIGMFGYLKKKKGIVWFLEQIERSHLSDQISLLFVGELDCETQQWLDLHSSLYYSQYPFVDRFDLIPYYLCCDWVAIPSFYDGMPNVMLEAMGLGVPLLASHIGGMGDILEHRHTGLLFQPENPHECVRSIHDAVTMTQADKTKINNAVQSLVTKRFTAKLEADGYIHIFNTTVSADIMENNYAFNTKFVI